MSITGSVRQAVVELLVRHPKSDALGAHRQLEGINSRILDGDADGLWPPGPRVVLS